MTKHTAGPEIATCPSCGEEVQADLIMDSGLCCDCDPENQENIKGDYIMDRELDA